MSILYISSPPYLNRDIISLKLLKAPENKLIKKLHHWVSGLFSDAIFLMHNRLARHLDQLRDSLALTAFCSSYIGQVCFGDCQPVSDVIEEVRECAHIVG